MGQFTISSQMAVGQSINRPLSHSGHTAIAISGGDWGDGKHRKQKPHSWKFNLHTILFANRYSIPIPRKI